MSERAPGRWQPFAKGGRPSPLERRHIVIGVCGLILAAAGVTEYTDGIVRYVTRIVDGHAWLDLWRPAFDPPPMNTYTYRPLTVAMVKLELLLCGRDTVWMTILHAASIPWLGFAVHRFLRTHGLESAATPAALTTMALPSMLFAGWLPVESDGIGAAFLCETGWALQMWRANPKSRRYLVLMGLAAFGAATTKETSAAACFGYLASVAWAYRREEARRWLTVLGIYSAALALLVTPLLLAQPEAHDFNVAAAGFSAEKALFFGAHNLTQLFYVTSSAGAVLVLLGAAFATAGGSARRWQVALVLAGVVLLLAAPPMRVYNHYESVIIDQIGYVLLCAGILLAGLSWMLLWPRGQPDRVVLVGTVLFLLFTLVVAPMLARQSRPDVSARLYAPVVPIVHGLAWAAGLALVRLRGRLLRPAAWVILVCFAATPLIGAANSIQLFRARMGVELEAKRALAQVLTRPGAHCPVVIATNRDNELATEELEALGVPWADCSRLFVPNKIALDPSDADIHAFEIQGHTYSHKPLDLRRLQEDLKEGRTPEGCVLLFVQTPRAMMDTADFWRFAGDFTWAFGKLPEFNEDVFTQQIEVQYREHTAFEMLFRRAGAREIKVEVPFDLLPLNPNELLTRLISGPPVIESYAFEGRILYFDACRR